MATDVIECAPLGAILYDDSVEGDAFVARVADRLASDGLRLAGVVQSNDVRADGDVCGMNLRELHSGQEIDIALDLGQAPGCKLDPAGLLRAAALVEQALQRGGVDLVVLNKFGKQEAGGGGLRTVLSDALVAGVPVLLGVSKLNLPACQEFAADAFVALPADIEAVASWCAAEGARLRRARESAR